MIAALGCVLVAGGTTAAPLQDSQDLKGLTIEELMGVDVTTPSRRAEPLSATAAAIVVITRDDIRRSGLTTIGDILQLADGVHVARSSANAWSIGARGFNGATPNKLLVMIDGRTMNSSIFTGVFWNVLDYVLEDIERIEVIRGPGAALWGANAVNGVVNIITRHSRDTQGNYALISSGPEDPALATYRYGGRATADVTWRAYGKVALHDAQRFADGSSSDDARQRGQVGFRVDGDGAEGTNWMIRGDAFHSSDSVPQRPDGEYTEIDVQGRWSRPITGASRLDLQTYYRREYRRVPRQLTHHVNVIDAEAQYSMTAATRHAIIVGGGIRHSADGSMGTLPLSLDPPDRSYSLTSLFAQDEFPLATDRLFLTLGAKFEHSPFSGGQLQPNARARLLLPHKQTAWAAVARAIRRPTRIDIDLVSAPTGVVTLVGSEDFRAETLVATEIGYRVQPVAAFSLDATAFLHSFDDLRSQERPVDAPFPVAFGNTLAGESHGVELAINLQPISRWRNHVSYTWMDTDIHRKPGSRDVSGGVNESNDPHYLFGLRSSLDLGGDVELDGYLRGVGELQNLGTPAYTELNLRLGWNVSRRTELWVSGQDLLHDSHPELGADTPTRVEFERAVRVGAAFRF